MENNTSEILTSNNSEYLYESDLKVPDLSEQSNELSSPEITEQATTTPTATGPTISSPAPTTATNKAESLVDVIDIDGKKVAPYLKNSFYNNINTSIGSFENTGTTLLLEDAEKLWKDPNIQAKFQNNKEYFDKAVMLTKTKYTADLFDFEKEKFNQQLYDMYKQEYDIRSAVNYGNFMNYYLKQNNKLRNYADVYEENKFRNSTQYAGTKEEVYKEYAPYLRNQTINVYDNPELFTKDYTAQQIASAKRYNENTGSTEWNIKTDFWDDMLNPKTIGFNFNSEGHQVYETDDQGNLYVRRLQGKEKHGSMGVEVVSAWGGMEKVEDRSSLPIWLAKTATKSIYNTTLNAVGGIASIGDAILNVFNPDIDALEKVRDSLFAAQFQHSQAINENFYNGYSLTTHILDGVSQLFVGAVAGAGVNSMVKFMKLTTDAGKLAQAAGKADDLLLIFKNNKVAQVLIGETYGAAASRLTLTSMWTGAVSDAAENAGLNPREAAMVTFATLGAGQIFGIFSDKALGFINTKAGVDALKKRLLHSANVGMVKDGAGKILINESAVNIAKSAKQVVQKIISNGTLQAAAGETIEEGLLEPLWEKGIMELSRHFKSMNIDPFERIKRDVWMNDNYSLEVMKEQALQGALIGGISGGLSHRITTFNNINLKDEDDVQLLHMMLENKDQLLLDGTDALAKQSEFASNKLYINTTTGQLVPYEPNLDKQVHSPLNDVIAGIMKQKINSYRKMLDNSGAQQIYDELTAKMSEADKKNFTHQFVNSHFKKINDVINKAVSYNANNDLAKAVKEYADAYNKIGTPEKVALLTPEQQAKYKEKMKKAQESMKSVLSAENTRVYYKMAWAANLIDMEHYNKTKTIIRRFPKFGQIYDMENYNKNLPEKYQQLKGKRDTEKTNYQNVLSEQNILLDEKLAPIDGLNSIDSFFAAYQKLPLNPDRTLDNISPEYGELISASKKYFNELLKLKAKYGADKGISDKIDALIAQFQSRIAETGTEEYFQDSLSEIEKIINTKVDNVPTFAEDVDILNSMYLMDFEVDSSKKIINLTDNTMESLIDKLTMDIENNIQVSDRDLQVLNNKILFLNDLIDFNHYVSVNVYGVDNTFESSLRKGEEELQTEMGLTPERGPDLTEKISKSKQDKKYTSVRNVAVPSLRFGKDAEIVYDGLSKEEHAILKEKITDLKDRMKVLILKAKENTRTIEEKEIEVYKNVYVGHMAALNELFASSEELSSAFQEKANQVNKLLKELVEENADFHSNLTEYLTETKANEKIEDRIKAWEVKNKTLQPDEFESERARALAEITKEFTDVFKITQWTNLYKIKSDLESNVFSTMNSTADGKSADDIIKAKQDILNNFKAIYEKNTVKNKQQYLISYPEDFNSETVGTYLEKAKWAYTYLESIMTYDKGLFNNHASDFIYSLTVVNKGEENHQREYQLPSLEHMEIAFQAVAQLSKDAKAKDNDLFDKYSNVLLTSSDAGTGKSTILMRMFAYAYQRTQPTDDLVTSLGGQYVALINQSQLTDDLSISGTENDFEFFVLDAPTSLTLKHYNPINKKNDKGFFTVKNKLTITGRGFFGNTTLVPGKKYAITNKGVQEVNITVNNKSKAMKVALPENKHVAFLFPTESLMNEQRDNLNKIGVIKNIATFTEMGLNGKREDIEVLRNKLKELQRYGVSVIVVDEVQRLQSTALSDHTTLLYDRDLFQEAKKLGISIYGLGDINQKTANESSNIFDVTNQNVIKHTNMLSLSYRDLSGEASLMAKAISNDIISYSNSDWNNIKRSDNGIFNILFSGSYYTNKEGQYEGTYFVNQTTKSDPYTKLKEMLKPFGNDYTVVINDSSDFSEAQRIFGTANIKVVSDVAGQTINNVVYFTSKPVEDNVGKLKSFYTAITRQKKFLAVVSPDIKVMDNFETRKRLGSTKDANKAKMSKVKLVTNALDSVASTVTAVKSPDQATAEARIKIEEVVKNYINEAQYIESVEVDYDKMEILPKDGGYRFPIKSITYEVEIKPEDDFFTNPISSEIHKSLKGKYALDELTDKKQEFSVPVNVTIPC